jgi:hypothetical protein
VGPRASLPRGANNWEIRFTGLSLLAPERVRFLYRLSGFEPDWVDAGARRSAFYTQVPPGEYQFEVRAANNDGVFSREPARLLIALPPRLHETLLFRGALALGLVLLGALGYAVRVRGLESRRRELERLVRERARRPSGSASARNASASWRSKRARCAPRCCRSPRTTSRTRCSSCSATPRWPSSRSSTASRWASSSGTSTSRRSACWRS